tara:strand:- start:10057 stop:10752 length:696 start_codon:yes stop_codon:yes gene_type:complete
MSFEVICPGCGALSGPSVGVCPFCKTVMSNSSNEKFAQSKSLAEIYESGRLDLALSLARKLYLEDPDSKTNIGFILLFVKILIETDAPSMQIRSVLSEARLIDPSNGDVLDYIEFIDAKNMLKKGYDDNGERQLKSILRRSPKHLQAHFLLGTHLFWIDEQTQQAIPHLETCVRLAPNHLRSWGCLGAIYRKLGNSQLAKAAFKRCIELETNVTMKSFFEKQIRDIEAIPK